MPVHYRLTPEHLHTACGEDISPDDTINGLKTTCPECRRLLAKQYFLTGRETPQPPTLRDQFAMAALAGMLSSDRWRGGQDTAVLAYEYADAMLKARETEDK